MKFYPDEKGSGKSFSHTEGGRNKFAPFKKRGGGRKMLPCLGEGGQKKFQTRDFPIL